MKDAEPQNGESPQNKKEEGPRKTGKIAPGIRPHKKGIIQHPAAEALLSRPIGGRPNQTVLNGTPFELMGDYIPPTPLPSQEEESKPVDRTEYAALQTGSGFTYHKTDHNDSQEDSDEEAVVGVEDSRTVEERIVAQMILLDDTREIFIDAAAEYLSQWFPKETIYYISEVNPQLTHTIGTERLRNLKKELRTLVNEVPAMTKEELSRDEYWLHRHTVGLENPFPHGEYNLMATDGRTPNRLDRGIRRVQGKLSDLLTAYGYLDETIIQQWVEYDNMHKQILFAPPFFPGLNSWTVLMREIVATYVQQMNQLNFLRGERMKASARQIWDALDLFDIDD